MSVFWRHRTEEVIHAGRLSDIYLLTAGYWKHFSVKSWIKFTRKISLHPLRKFASELLLMLEEFRLIDIIMKERPGTAMHLKLEGKLMSTFIKMHCHRICRKVFLADAMMNQLFISLHEGMFAETSIDWDATSSTMISFNPFCNTLMIQKVQRTIHLLRIELQGLLKGQLTRILSINIIQRGIPLPKKILYFIIIKGWLTLKKARKVQKKQLKKCFGLGIVKAKVNQASTLNLNLNMAALGRVTPTMQRQAMKMLKSKRRAQVIQRGMTVIAGRMTASDKTDKRDRKMKAGKMFGKEHLNVVYEEQRDRSH